MFKSLKSVWYTCKIFTMSAKYETKATQVFQLPIALRLRPGHVPLNNGQKPCKLILKESFNNFD